MLSISQHIPQVQIQRFGGGVGGWNPPLTDVLDICAMPHTLDMWAILDLFIIPFTFNTLDILTLYSL